MMAVSQTWLSGSTLFVKTDDAATSVEVRLVESRTEILDVTTSDGAVVIASFPAIAVGTVEFQGGAGDDRFVNNVRNLPTRAFGFGGNDYLEGHNARDEFVGGDGDDTLVGYGGHDLLSGGNGHDIILGGNGNDQLTGDAGNDQLNGQAGNDRLWGGNGNDVLIAIDSGTSDSASGGLGHDAFWVDLNGSPTGIAGESRDTVTDATSVDTVQTVSSFANGADRTLDGDRIADPTVTANNITYRAFAGNPLFARSGPDISDIRQASLGDCYFLAGLGAIALDFPLALRQNIVDFNDGSYGVRLGNSFYRIDNDLPVRSGSSQPFYVNLGRGRSMWVAVAQKAFAHYRRGENSYASIVGGHPNEANVAFGATNASSRSFASYGNATTLADELNKLFDGRQSATLSAMSGPANGPLVLTHAYTLRSFVKNQSGGIIGIVVRNPWGVDGGSLTDSNPFDGLVTLTPNELFQYGGFVWWGRL